MRKEWGSFFNSYNFFSSSIIIFMETFKPMDYIFGIMPLSPLALRSFILRSLIFYITFINDSLKNELDSHWKWAGWYSNSDGMSTEGFTIEYGESLGSFKYRELWNEIIEPKCGTRWTGEWKQIFIYILIKEIIGGDNL